MEALTLTRKDYEEGLEKAGDSIVNGESYASQFKIYFPEGLNTASALEICRVIQDDSLEGRIRLSKICIADKTVEFVCPNGEKERIHLSSANDSLEGFEFIHKEPFALIALSDAIYGYILKKSLRLPKPKTAAAETSTLQE